MTIKEILRLNDGKEELEMTFDPTTMETKIGNIELSKSDLMKLAVFFENAISAKTFKDHKDNSVITKIIKKIGGEEIVKED